MPYKNNSGIYKILNNINGKFYIGSAKSINKRFHEHEYNLKNNNHPNLHLQNAWNKYGEENFKFIIIEEIDNTIDNLKDFLLEREQYWIDNTNCIDRKIGYNMCINSYSRLGVKTSPVGIKNIKKGLIERWSKTEDRTHISTLSDRLIKERGVETYISRQKLSPENVLDIMVRFSNGEKTSDIAKYYNISWTLINDIKLGKKWSHITGVPKIKRNQKKVKSVI